MASSRILKMSLDLFIEVVDLADFRGVASLALASKLHARAVLPFLYDKLPQSEGSKDCTTTCEYVLDWAATHGFIATIEKVWNHHPTLRDLIDRPIEDGYRTTEKGGPGLTLLHTAAAHGHVDVVEFLIAQGADVNSSNKGCLVPLHFAATGPVVMALARHGSSLDHAISPLAHSISGPAKCDGAAVQALFDLGLGSKCHRLGLTVGMAAVVRGEPDILEMVLGHGLSPYGRAVMEEQAILEAVRHHGHIPSKVTKVIRILVRVGIPVNPPDRLQSPLLRVCLLPGEISARASIKTLLECGANVNVADDDLQTALHRIVSRVRIEVAHIEEMADRLHGVLFTKGAFQVDVKARDRNGKTAFEALAGLRLWQMDGEQLAMEMMTRERMLGMLLQSGCSIRDTVGHVVVFPEYCGGTILHTVCQSNDPTLLEYILNNGGRDCINHQTEKGYTPLMLLVLGHYSSFWTFVSTFLPMKKLLLDNGADINMTDSLGCTAWHMLMENWSIQANSLGIDTTNWFWRTLVRDLKPEHAERRGRFS